MAANISRVGKTLNFRGRIQKNLCTSSPRAIRDAHHVFAANPSNPRPVPFIDQVKLADQVSAIPETPTAATAALL
jgi:hypothetical protein